MPRLFQWLTLVNPMRHYLEIVRGIFLKGAGIEIIWPKLVALALIGTVILTVATVRFRRTSL